ncbi:MAG: glucosaminidase domain-containing protein [Armatimonadota bacterium]|nr:glucosaminidase domain-containing protein [Armatimonadota bacterium]MDR7402908.1 glucosaminidase domain-containing protein [Armatimonadota bacterium]MDR7438181.1 glucosaminidase domain-containing protein [Armatimonadota bacterium]MDR7473245.1 glucosaminidase domain-containing protein [Armatimonadota bacterium]MDR7508028.1 glucosaminidase domain-containing protein [Armatimonadota bacterium]
MALSGEQRAFLARLRVFIPQAEAAGVPGAVMVAQAVLESNWGRSGLARMGQALFGVKAGPGWPGAVYCGTTREWVAGRGLVVIPGTHRVYAGYPEAVAAGCPPGALFRAYANLEDNIADYLAFFQRSARFRPALDAYARTRDPRRFAREIARAGYATAPWYGAALVAFMERHLADLLPPRVVVRWNGIPLPDDAVWWRDGRVYVRLRALAALRGWRVDYDPAARTVRVTEGGGP